MLGSTGSIGTQTLEIVRGHPDRFRVEALAANSNWELLAEQAAEFLPKHVFVADAGCHARLSERLAGLPVEVHTGDEALVGLCADAASTTVVNSLVGFAGFVPTYTALKAGKRVALANKESLVAGGEILRDQIGYTLETLMPVDSEHSAIWQCLAGERTEDVDRLIVTASGGPFRNLTKEQLREVTVDQALKHPNWSMGAKITIDSSTLMNKGLEIIEAYWLFGIPLERIDAVVHPQSLIHSMVVFVDGSIKAQMGLPDMRLPIQYALSAPARWPLPATPVDWASAVTMDFCPVDHERFPCLGLARQALKAGGFAPAVLNAANEVAVACFLNREIPYIAISAIVAECLERFDETPPMTVESMTHVNLQARRLALSIARQT